MNKELDTLISTNEGLMIEFFEYMYGRKLSRDEAQVVASTVNELNNLRQISFEEYLKLKDKHGNMPYDTLLVTTVIFDRLYGKEK